MTFVQYILFSFALLLQWMFVVTQVSWGNCDGQTQDITLLNLTVNPDPILAPGSVSISITISTSQNLTSPLKATLSLRKKILIGYIPVPCFTIGTCTYDDLCSICTKCKCPMEIGEHVLSLPMTIESGSWMLTGYYQAQIDLKSGSGQKGCVKLDNVSIRKA